MGTAGTVRLCRIVLNFGSRHGGAQPRMCHIPYRSDHHLQACFGISVRSKHLRNLHLQVLHLYAHEAGTGLNQELEQAPSHKTELQLHQATGQPELPDEAGRGMTQAALCRLRAMGTLKMSGCELAMLVLLELCSVELRAPAALCSLSLETCKDVVNVPDCISKLPRLTKLCLRKGSVDPEAGLASVHSKAELAQLQGLKHLELLHISRVHINVTGPAGALTALTYLSIQDLGKHKQLPAAFDSCAQLQELSLGGSNLEQLAVSLSQLQQLRSIHVKYAPKLARLVARDEVPVKVKTIALVRVARKVQIPRCWVEGRAASEYAGCHICIDTSSQLCYGSGFTVPHNPRERFVGDIQTLMVRHQAQCALLSRRDPALSNLSIVAVLLATTAFVAFGQSHTKPAGLGPAFPKRADDQPDVATSAARQAAKRAAQRLRSFFVYDQLAFAFAMTVVVLIVASFIPHFAVGTRQARAGRTWLKIAALSLVLASAVMSEMLSFFYAALASYPSEIRGQDVWGPQLCGLLLVGSAVLWWVRALVRLWPGGLALLEALGIARASVDADGVQSPRASCCGGKAGAPKCSKTRIFYLFAGTALALVPTVGGWLILRSQAKKNPTTTDRTVLARYVTVWWVVLAVTTCVWLLFVALMRNINEEVELPEPSVDESAAELVKLVRGNLQHADDEHTESSSVLALLQSINAAVSGYKRSDATEQPGAVIAALQSVVDGQQMLGNKLDDLCHKLCDAMGYCHGRSVRTCSA